MGRTIAALVAMDSIAELTANALYGRATWEIKAWSI